MKNFDTKRFCRVLKLDFAEGLKPMLWGTLAMLLLYLFFFWFAHNIAFDGSWWKEHPEIFVKEVCESVGYFSCAAMYIFFLIAVSILYRGEQKKQVRIAWLMLPATNLEKFLSRWIYMLAFSLAGGLLAFLMADAIHMAWLGISGMPIADAASYFFKLFPHTDKYTRVPEIISIYGMMVALHSFYLLGSVLFRKYHFIVSSACVVLFFAVIATLLKTVFTAKSSMVVDSTTSCIILIAQETAVIVLFTWLAYHLFCRWQVVTRKFVNL